MRSELPEKRQKTGVGIIQKTKNMKLICNTLFLAILFSITLSAQDEKKAIIKMLEAETEAWSNVDYEKWASCWVHSDIAQLATTQPNATILIEGW